MKITLVLKKLPCAAFFLGGTVLYTAAYFKNKAAKKRLEDYLKAGELEFEDEDCELSWLDELDDDFRPHRYSTVGLKSYNPFAYICSEEDIAEFAVALISNTEDNGGDLSLQKAESYLLQALIAYIHFEAPIEERNMDMLVEMINSLDVRENDEDFKNAVDFLFEVIADRHPQHYAVQQYELYKLAVCKPSGITKNSVIGSCQKRLESLLFFGMAAICKKISNGCEDKGCEL